MEAAMEALHQLKSTEAPLWLAPKQELSESVRLASKLLFSCLKPHTPKLPFDQLLVEGFDAEQIGLQIDLQSQPLISSLRREVRKFDKNPKEISKLNQAFKGPIEEKTGRGFDQVDDDDDDDEDEDDDMALDSDEGDESEEKEEKEEEEDEDTGSEGEGIEDGFLKLKELRKYCEEDEAKEFGLKKKTISKGNRNEEDDDEEGEDDEEDEEEEDELGVFDEDEEADKLASARYEDFYGSEKKKNLKRKARYDSEETSSSEDEQDDDNATGYQKRNDLSNHEKELKKLHSKIEQMGKSNMDPKAWTMLGEVIVVQRKRNR